MNRQELLTVVRAYTPGGSVNNREIMNAVDDYLSADRKRTRDAVLDEVLGVIGVNKQIYFTSDGFTQTQEQFNRNDKTYSAIHAELKDTATWVKAGGKLELHHIDKSAARIMKANRAELGQAITAMKGEEK